ncbi:MAG: RNA-protein complex protein Nop10 [Candidatus Methanosuratus sp.]|nr:RNA-protein complex protein Nop10 [Candidatus Methanosuratincola sp.]
MRGMLRRCTSCGAYTIKQDSCPRCGGALKIPHPAKFSPYDKYSRFRLALKEESAKKG